MGGAHGERMVCCMTNNCMVFCSIPVKLKQGNGQATGSSYLSSYGGFNATAQTAAQYPYG